MQLFMFETFPRHRSGNYKETMIKVAHFTSRETRIPARGRAARHSGRRRDKHS